MRNPSAHFEDYRNSCHGMLEEITTTMYDTMMFIPGSTTRLNFFQQVKPTKVESNLYFPGQLPNPCAFDIHCIRINGINTRLMHGACELRIANKIYGTNPAWSYAMKEKGMPCTPPLFIGPLQYFIFSMEWDTGTPFPFKGFDGQRVMVHPLQVCFQGQMLRAVC